MFHKKSLKLAGLYLTIIMLISLFFSLTIYQLSTQELDRGLRHIPPGIAAAGSLPKQAREVLHNERENQYQEAKSRVFSRLVAANFIILFVSGFLSYYLAHRTLRPIEEANESLERFTADASHELRTPIAAMQSEIEVGLMDPKLKSPAARKILTSNLEELAKLTALTSGLLKLAHQETGTLLQNEVSVDTVIQQALARVEPLAGNKQIKLNAPSPTRHLVLGDEVGLTEALFIVLDNAVKYSPEKTSVDVAVAQKQKRIQIKIIDHGIGIGAAELPHIFDRFYRADSARSKNQVEGYGIGLALAKHIVELHGGSIDVASKPGDGSIFRIRLPLA